ncbi:WYL domain-containing protein [Campylobacter volucris]|uniref:helix-turn-helix transcriptional regulator n=1 Tax=Campylobacter volucris TaxID=1031542 RepID=UPI00189DB853|nr:WYL domain-containing protein [Campylobacter volucris]MBF7049762.1 WYL domain-containing protein [Campylobacter volucris]MBF7060842.1 WYL domain-containing protein [Campylobacter volucris]
MDKDKLSTRLVSILQYLNNGERFSLEELAQEFNVSIRTIQRDLHDRLAFMPIKKENGKYFLESYALGKLSFKDIQNFAILSGIGKLYPSLDKEFLNDLLNKKINKAFLIKNKNYEILNRENFEDLSTAIIAKYTINFYYKEKCRKVYPYKLINIDNIWYLLADENDTLKTFTFSKISKLKINKKENFTPKEKFISQIEKNQNNWIVEKEKEAILKIDKKTKEYFLRKNTSNKYELIKENENFIYIKIFYSYDDELLNLVRYWTPYMKICQPLILKEKLYEQLTLYMKD